MMRYLLRIGDETLLRITLAVMMLLGLVIYFADNIFVSIPAGHAGVLWSRLFGGTQVERVYREGMHLILPWDRVTLYDVRGQNLTQNLEAITADGLHLAFTLDIRYHLIIDQLGQLQRNLGPGYDTALLVPTVTAFVRSQMSRYTAEEIYSTHRSFIERQVYDFMRQNQNVLLRDGVTGLSFINYDAILINGIRLPKRLQAAIESKMVQQEATEEWVFRIQREQLESQRREIEAAATRRVLDTLGNSLTDTFVRLRYVEVLERLANSPNTKIIVTGSGAVPPALMVGSEAGGATPAPDAAAPLPQAGSIQPPVVVPLMPPQGVPGREPETIHGIAPDLMNGLRRAAPPDTPPPESAVPRTP